MCPTIISRPNLATGQISWQTFDILQTLGTLSRNRIRIPEFDSGFDKLTQATLYQQHVLELWATAN